MLSTLKISKKIVALLAIALMCVGCSSVPSMSYNPWEPISIPTDAKLFDIAFTDNPNHGFIVGSKAALLETQDGGETWNPIILQLGEGNYRFNAIDFAGSEGWIAVEPSTLLHTNDEGKTWSSIPLSEKLPGNPVSIVALGKDSAEMATDVGAIYKTTDGGKNWKAQVAESVGVVRNIERSDDGRYIAVSGKGNFYSTWEPGQNAWVQHNRNSSRKVENMGFAENGQMWMLARGGQIQFSEPNNSEQWLDAQYPELSTSWGLLDLAYRTPSEIWVSGGSANLLRSTDGGQTWEKDRDVEDVATNFYKIVFLSPEKGFVIGDRGFLLKYQPDIVPSTESSKA
ncbi:MAG: photosynthesis system II assembly factor Ycf48 [Nostocales cyanobacterium 94392]|nr:photosynthesis system II assembly factor Ycf48 [Nostocales cyanobacterium 94392]